MTRVRLANQEVVTDEIHNFDNLRDSKNRQMGVMVWIRREEYVEDKVNWGCCSNVEPGVSFFLAVHQTRNNQFYGSGYTNFRFNTFEDAKQKADELVAKRRKEYTKKYSQQ